MRRAVLLLCSVTAATALGATTILRLGDLKTTPNFFVGSALSSASLNGLTFFTHPDLDTGTELFTTDGTSGGTQRFVDLMPGPLSSNAQAIAVLGNRLLFQARDDEHGTELWVSDGTPAGTTLLADVWPGPTSGFSVPLGVLGANFFFSADDGEHGSEPWVTDGTPGGTKLLADLNPSNSSGPNTFVPVGGLAYFLANNGSGVFSIFQTDGTTSGTARLAVLDGLGLTLVRDLSAASGLLRFNAFTAAEGLEPWVTDGTDAGTMLLRDISPGPSNSMPGLTYTFGSNAAFFVDSPGGLIATDGTPAGTRQLMSIAGYQPVLGSFGATVAVGSGNTLFFPAAETGLDQELWATDGTDAGTRLVKDINPAASSSIRMLTAAAGGVYFLADDGTGFEPWFSDGTTPGTQALARFRPDGGQVQFARASVMADGGILFLVSFGDNSEELWRSGGTPATTSRVTGWAPLPLSSNPSAFVAVDGGVAFVAGTDAGSAGLFTSDGTPLGTRQWPQLPVGPAPIHYRYGAALGCNDGSSGFEPCFISDIASGATLLADVVPGASSSVPVEMVNADNRLYFRPGNTFKLGAELPDAGFRLLDCEGGNMQAPLVAFGGRAVFRSSGIPSVITCITDGTDAGTYRIGGEVRADSATLPQKLVTANRGATGEELYVTSGDPGGFTLVTDIESGPKSSAPAQFVNASGAVYFVATDTAHGAELWRYDGVNTTLVKDIRPGTAGSAPTNLRAINGQLFFGADDGVTGREPWTSDGTTGGTVRLADLRPGAAGSYPDGFAAFGAAAVVFTADDGTTGREPWRLKASGQLDQIADLVPGPRGSTPANFLFASGKLFFSAADSTGDVEPYVATGDEDAGTSDAGVVDAGTSDGGATDAGLTDAGVSDGGAGDGGAPDAGVGDGGLVVADGGAPEPLPRTLHVACGCGSTSGSAFSLLVALLYALRAGTPRTTRLRPSIGKSTSST